MSFETYKTMLLILSTLFVGSATGVILRSKEPSLMGRIKDQQKALVWEGGLALLFFVVATITWIFSGAPR